MAALSQYFKMVKFAHSIFALPFALVGFFMALHLNHLSFDYFKLIYIVLAMVFARNAAMGFNRYLDRNIDRENERTRSREVASGVISERNALIFILANVALFMATSFLINILAFWLSPVALLVVLGYSFTKRFTALCHLVLGLGLALAPIGAYISVTGSFNNIVPILISFVVLFWTAGFDIIYALQDEQFDRQQQLHSIPTLVGAKRALIISRLLHVSSAILMLASGWLMNANLWYFVGAISFISLLLRQHLLVKHNDLSKVDAAFFTSNGIASVVFAFFCILSFYL